MATSTAPTATVEQIVGSREGMPSQLIEVLQDLQEACGFISEEAMSRVSARLGVPLIVTDITEGCGRPAARSDGRPGGDDDDPALPRPDETGPGAPVRPVRIPSRFDRPPASVSKNRSDSVAAILGLNISNSDIHY
jgi:hypothetical protein